MVLYRKVELLNVNKPATHGPAAILHDAPVKNSVGISDDNEFIQS